MYINKIQKLILFPVLIILLISTVYATFFEDMSTNPNDYLTYDDGGDTQTIDGNTTLPANATLLENRGWTSTIVQEPKYTNNCAYEGTRGINLPSTADYEMRVNINQTGQILEGTCFFYSAKIAVRSNFNIHRIGYSASENNNIGNTTGILFRNQSIAPPVDLSWYFEGPQDLGGTNVSYESAYIFVNYTICTNTSEVTGYQNGLAIKSQATTPNSEVMRALFWSMSTSVPGVSLDEEFCVDNVRVWDGTIFDFPLITIPAEPILFIDWDSLEPVNDTFRNDNPLTFFYDVVNVTTEAQCEFFHNLTGSLSLNQTEFSVFNETRNFNYTPLTGQVDDVLFQITCNDTSLNISSTSQKVIHIDIVNVLIDINNPANNTNFNEDQLSFNINITYLNINLDFVNFSVEYPNGSLLQENSSSDLIVSDFLFNDLITIPSNAFGVYTINTFGNDSAGNIGVDTTFFTLLDNNLVVFWDTLTPLNNSNLTNQSIVEFNYNLVLSNLSTTTCELFENNILDDTQVRVTSGNFSFSKTFAATFDATNIYKINCTSSVLDSQTTEKTISVVNSETTRVLHGFIAILPSLVVLVLFIFIIKLVFGKNKT